MTSEAPTVIGLPNDKLQDSDNFYEHPRVFFNQVQQSMVLFLVLGRFIFCCWNFEAFFKQILPSMNFFDM